MIVYPQLAARDEHVTARRAETVIDLGPAGRPIHRAVIVAVRGRRELVAYCIRGFQTCRATRRSLGLIPRVESQPIRHRAVIARIRHETHARVCVVGQKPRIGAVDRAEGIPIAAALGRVLPGAVRIVHPDDRDAFERTSIAVADLPGDQVGNERARVGKVVLVDLR